MKKLWAAILAAVCAITLAGCKGADGSGSGGGGSGDNTGDSTSGAPTPEAKIDIDFTAMNNIMIGAQAQEVLDNAPQKYAGQTFKVRGVYGNAEVEGEFLHAAFVIDENSCCVTATFEFILDGERLSLDRYPEIDAEIEITGVYRSYADIDVDRDGYYLDVDEIVLV